MTPSLRPSKVPNLIPNNQQISGDGDGTTVTGKALLGAMAILALLLGGVIKRDDEDDEDDEDEIDEFDIE